jgi:hypothetical protein
MLTIYLHVSHTARKGADNPNLLTSETQFDAVILTEGTASVVSWSHFLAAGPEVSGSIPGAARFSEYQWVWNGVHSALVRINEELLERKVAAPVKKLRLMTVGDLPR